MKFFNEDIKLKENYQYNDTYNNNKEQNNYSDNKFLDQF